MSRSQITLWCLIEGDSQLFEVTIHSNKSINHLKELIHERGIERTIHAKDLILCKVSIDLDGHTDNSLRQLVMTGDDESVAKLTSHLTVGQYWPVQPGKAIHVFVKRPAAATVESGSGESLGPKIESSDLVQIYDDVIIETQTRGHFTDDDVTANDIVYATDIPEFVQKFMQMLCEKRGVAHRMLPFAEELVQMGCDMYFDQSSPDPTHIADKFELFHLLQLAAIYEKRFPRRKGGVNKPFKEDDGNWLFFDSVSRHFEAAPVECEITVSMGNEPWPFQLVIEVNREYFTYRPRSDFLVLKSLLPRLLVEINSTTSDRTPQDRHCMLLQGASTVRFANKFLNAFSQNKDFVMVAIFVGDDAKADRYILFQSPRSTEVHYEIRSFDLTKQGDRFQFALELYNFSSGLREGADGNDTKGKMNDFKTVVQNHKKQFKMKSYCSKGDKRKRPAEGEGDQSRYSGDGSRAVQELQEHGYHVVPNTFEDEGGTWELLFQPPSHIHTVYRATDPSKTDLIAKQVDKELNELEILKYLRTIQPQSPYIISFIETFATNCGNWIIFPKMHSILELPMHVNREQLCGVQLGRDLIAGLAYLHEHGVAHLDINPGNLVYTEHFRLRIIDFDLAVRVESESEEVEGVFGTPGWMAPEIDQDKCIKFSPIRADRWSCGKVLLKLVGTQSEDLVKFAKRLMDREPRRRPSLLEWSQASASRAGIGADDEPTRLAKRRKTNFG